MLISPEETRALADMLRIGITDEEAQRLSHDMSSVLDYVRLLDNVDVTGIDPMGVGADGYALLREDIPGPSLPQEDLEMLSGGAFDSQTGSFVTKPIFS